MWWQGQQQRRRLWARRKEGEELDGLRNSRVVTEPHAAREARDIDRPDRQAFAHLFESCHDMEGAASTKSLAV